jgi:hypothetical protein
MKPDSHNPKGSPMFCHLKLFCVDADENQAQFVREFGSADQDDSQWVTSFATNRGCPDAVFVIRIRALWSSRG